MNTELNQDSIMTSEEVAPIMLQKSARKQRATKATIRTFLHWALENHAYDQYTPGRIRQMYNEQFNVDISECCIRRQRGKWQLVNGEVKPINNQ